MLCFLKSGGRKNLPLPYDRWRLYDLPLSFNFNQMQKGPTLKQLMFRMELVRFGDTICRSNLIMVRHSANCQIIHPALLALKRRTPKMGVQVLVAGIFLVSFCELRYRFAVINADPIASIMNEVTGFA